MSNFIKKGVRKTTLNKKKLGEILKPSTDGNNFSLIAVGRENDVLLEDVFDFFGAFITETFTAENNWEAYSLKDSTLFKNKETDTEAAMLPVGHNHNDEPSIWDVRIDTNMKDLFINYIQLRRLFLTSTKKQ